MQKKNYFTTVNQLAEGLMFSAFTLAFVGFCAVIAVLMGASKGNSLARTRNISTATVGLFLLSGMSAWYFVSEFYTLSKTLIGKKITKERY